MKRTLSVILVLFLISCREKKAAEATQPRSEPKTSYGQNVDSAKKMKAELEKRDQEISQQEKEIFQDH